MRAVFSDCHSQLNEAPPASSRTGRLGNALEMGSFVSGRGVEGEGAGDVCTVTATTTTSVVLEVEWEVFRRIGLGVWRGRGAWKHIS